MSAAVIVFPGSNCDRDCKVAVERSTGERVEMVWHQETELPSGLDLIILPGGFSYGDYLRCGAMAVQSPVMQAVKKAADDGVAVVGICNGFQLLCEAGMLPGALQIVALGMPHAPARMLEMGVRLRVDGVTPRAVQRDACGGRGRGGGDRRRLLRR